MAASTESSRLAAEFFLSPESDDEESFVVLGSSLPPESLVIDGGTEAVQTIDTAAAQESLRLTASAISQLYSSASSLPSMPKVNGQELVISVDENGLRSPTANSSVDLSPDEIQQKIDLLIEENMKLKETLHQNNLGIKKQYDMLVLWQEEVMRVHQSHKEKFAETKKYIENLKIENAKLTETAKLSQAAQANMQQELQLLKSQQEDAGAKEKLEFSFLKTTFDNLKEFELEAAQKKITDLEGQVNMLNKLKIENEEKYMAQSRMPSQVQDLQKELAVTKQQNTQTTAECGKQLQEAESLQKILLEEIKVLKAQVYEKVKTDVTKETHDNVQEQLMAAQMHITKLELLRNEDKDVINVKEETIAKMENLIKEMGDSSDTMAALRAQLELYKSDFEAERQAKDAIKAEKEQITEDLRHLQRRNQQLLEEVERLRAGDFVHVNTPERPEQAVAASPSAPQDRSTARFACPKCNFKFWDYQALENHVYRCIEIDSLF